MLETSAKNRIPQAKNIPYQPIFSVQRVRFQSCLKSRFLHPNINLFICNLSQTKFWPRTMSEWNSLPDNVIEMGENDFRKVASNYVV